MKSIKKQLLVFITLACIILPAQYVSAACSPYVGMASLNEFFKDRANQAFDADDFVEVKILNGNIDSTIFNTWTLQVCEDNDAGNNNDADGCSGAISLSSFTETTPPWLTLNGNIGRYVNFKTGFDAILLDNNGDVIDYVSVDGYNPQEDGSCPGSSLPFDYTASAPGASDKFIFRSPDGTGEWEDAPSASAPPTEDDTNDEDPSGNPAPAISVTNVTVFKGEDATFTLSITSAQTYDIKVTYTTQDVSQNPTATAVAGTDFTTTTGEATIVQNTTSTTVTVPTLANSPSGEVFFYLYLYDPENGTVTNHYPTGTILANPTGDWQMDETTWNGSANEVIDSSANTNHGATFNSLGNTVAYLCNGGSFDGADDYIDIPHDNTLNGSSELTYAAWIRPDTWNGNFLVGSRRQVMGKSVHQAGAQMGIFSDAGVLKGRAETLAGQYEVSTALPSTSQWTHVALVFSGTELRMYINGNSVTNTNFATTTLVQTTDPLSIGRRYKTGILSWLWAYNFDGLIDETLVFNSAIPATGIQRMYNYYQGGLSWNGAARTCPSAGLHHIEIQHDGTGLTCEPETITVRACANSSCSNLYASDVNVTFSNTGWVGGDTQTINNGQSTFQFRNTSATTVNYGVSSSAPSANNAVECLNTATSSNSCSQTFYDTGFIYTIPTQTSCTTSAPVTISAVRLDNTTQACVPTFVSQTRNIDFSLSYVNPNSGTSDLTLNHGATDYTPIDDTTSQTVPISFDGSGQATFTVTYPDAGQITLNSLYTGSVGTGDAGLSMNGAESFITKPAKLYVFADEANSSCTGSISTCSGFRAAGDTFNLKVRGACSDNSVTPNFELSGMTISHTNTAPAISQGTLGVSTFDTLAADNGEATISQTVSEVGAFTFTAGLPAGGYFGETIGTAALNTSGEIGRFYPGHFCLSTNSIVNRTDTDTATSCTDGFSYLDEEFDVRFTLTAQAMNAVCSDGSSTINYDNTWSKFSTPFTEDTTNANELGKWNFGAVNDPTGTPTNLNSRISINTAASSPTVFTNGQAAITSVMNINRSGTAPNYTAETAFADVRVGIKPIDNDNVTMDTTDLTIGADSYREAGNTALYFGRLFAENAFGTDQADVGLDMYARTEYCNAVSAGVCTDWQPKNDDSCTLYNITPPAGVQLGADPGSIGTPGYYQRVSPTVTSSVFNFNDSGAAASYARVHVPDTNNHSAGWRLFYTAGGNGGNFTIPFSFPFNTDTSVHPYLLHVDGVASFGQFRGDDRIIFWREILE